MPDIQLESYNKAVKGFDEMNAKEIEVPLSTGRETPMHALPDGSCDTHFHIYDPVNFPYWSGDTRNQPPAEVNAYQLLQQRLGLSRAVIVTPSAYQNNNDCTIDALKKMGKDSTRAIVVVKPSISDEKLHQMDELGVRGVRFNLASLGGDTNGIAETIKQMAKRIAPMNWVMSFWMNPDLIVSLADELAQLPVPILFDHQGHIDPRKGVNDPAFKAICHLQNAGKAWVDVSAPYIDTQTGADTDTIRLGKAFIKNNYRQVIWGTDWPHTTEWHRRRVMPDDAELVNFLWDQVDHDDQKFHQILVDTPAKLFGFEN